MPHSRGGSVDWRDAHAYAHAYAHAHARTRAYASHAWREPIVLHTRTMFVRTAGTRPQHTRPVLGVACAPPRTRPPVLGLEPIREKIKKTGETPLPSEP